LSTVTTEELRPPTRRRRADGERSREAILMTAARLATTEGLTGLSLARLADAVGMSKSGLFAHFRSKEDLQLATIETADRVFRDVVIAPAAEAPAGRLRLEALVARFLQHVADGVFPGGCFFASVAAEIDTQPGPVRDRALRTIGEWNGLLRDALQEGQRAGEIPAEVDADQLAFEVGAFLLLANAQYVVAGGDHAPLDRARRAVERLLAL